MSIYDLSGNIVSAGGGSNGTNCKIIAHRGYHVTAKQNTIPAFKAASDNGFNWIEIDTRKTSDGIYVMAHDNSVTLYNNGSATSVTISSANYSTIKSYTWDSAGLYKLCTLQAVCESLKLYDMNMIIDRKSGTNAEIMEIVSMAGAVDRVMLSYSSYSDAVADVALLQQYDSVPIRVWSSASGYASYLSLISQIANPIYADINATNANNTCISMALACGIPIIFSGCTDSNYNIWAVLANGCMANLDLNISRADFESILNIDYDKATAITLSVSSVSISGTGTSSVTASSDISTGGGYVYAFTTDPRIATVTQTAFGSSASFTVTGVSAGTTQMVVFNGCGEVKRITVTVS